MLGSRILCACRPQKKGTQHCVTVTSEQPVNAETGAYIVAIFAVLYFFTHPCPFPFFIYPSPFPTSTFFDPPPSLLFSFLVLSQLENFASPSPTAPLHPITLKRYEVARIELVIRKRHRSKNWVATQTVSHGL